SVSNTVNTKIFGEGAPLGNSSNEEDQLSSRFGDHVCPASVRTCDRNLACTDDVDLLRHSVAAARRSTACDRKPNTAERLLRSPSRRWPPSPRAESSAERGRSAGTRPLR